MHNERIYSAPSLSEIINQLSIYRPTGVLTLWRPGRARQEDARITIERGRPLQVFWRTYRKDMDLAMLNWLNAWGEIHFSFRASLPTTHQIPQSTTEPPAFKPPVVPAHSPTQAGISAITRPLPALPSKGQLSPDLQPHANNEQWDEQISTGSGRTQELPITRILRNSDETSNRTTQRQPLSGPAHERVVPSLTQTGKDFSAAQLPRYDRTIFLLINGRRTVVDLAQLTKRSLEEVYGSLIRLKNGQLISIEAQPAPAQ